MIFNELWQYIRLGNTHVDVCIAFSTRWRIFQINQANKSLMMSGFFVSPWTSYQIRKIAGCACAGNARNVFPRRWFQWKPLVSDPGMHHGTCVTHVPWWMSGSLTRGDGENIPGACAPAIMHIWQEAYVITYHLIESMWYHRLFVWLDSFLDWMHFNIFVSLM